MIQVVIRRLEPALGLTLGFMLFSGLSFAQQANFSGDWKLKETQYVEGNRYGNAMAKSIGIKQDSDSFWLNRAFDDGKGNLTPIQETLAQNGKQTSRVTIKSKRKKVLTLAWAADKESFVITIVTYAPSDDSKMDFRDTDTYSLDASGGLTVDHKSENFTNSDNYECKGIYQK